MQSPARARLCFALDVPDAVAALALVDELAGDVGVFKIGLELFVAEGPAVVRQVRQRGVDVFLDLKLHDIGHTVANAVARAVDLDVRFLTVHASGGPGMLAAAAAAAAAGSSTTLLAVTALTSLTDDDLAAAGFAHGAVTLVPTLAQLAASSGIGGVVCSPHEVGAVRRVAPSLVCVTPGVRGASDERGDQARAATAAAAIAGGADVVVVGRPIKNAPDRRAAAARFVADIEQGLRARTAPAPRSPS